MWHHRGVKLGVTAIVLVMAAVPASAQVFVPRDKLLKAPVAVKSDKAAKAAPVVAAASDKKAAPAPAPAATPARKTTRPAVARRKDRPDDLTPEPSKKSKKTTKAKKSDRVVVEDDDDD